MIFDLKKISKYYKTEYGVNLGLDNVNLTLFRGEIVGISGSSGSGKSTLLNVLAGLLNPDEGKFFYYYEEITKLSLAEKKQRIFREITYISQDFQLLEELTVYDNIKLALIGANYPRTDLEERIKELVFLVELEPEQKKRARLLSGGQRQRLVIARELAKDSEIIMADEPTSNLDKKTSQQIIGIFEKIAKDKLVIIVSHDLSEISEIMTRKIVLSGGTIISDSSSSKNELEKDDRVETVKGKTSTSVFKTLLWQQVKIRRLTYLWYTLLVSWLLILIMVPTAFSEISEKSNSLDTYGFRFFESDVSLTLADLYIQRERHLGSRLYFPITNTMEHLKNENPTILRLPSSQISGLEAKAYQIETSGKLLLSDLIRGRMPDAKYEVVINRNSVNLIGDIIEIKLGEISTKFEIVGFTGQEYFSDTIYISEFFFFDYDGIYQYDNLSRLVKLVDGNFHAVEKTGLSYLVSPVLTDADSSTMYLPIDLYLKYVNKEITFDLSINQFLGQMIPPMKLSVDRVVIDANLKGGEGKFLYPKNRFLNNDKSPYFSLNSYYYYTGSSIHDKTRLTQSLLKTGFKVNEYKNDEMESEIVTVFNGLLVALAFLIGLVVSFALGKNTSQTGVENFQALDKMNFSVKKIVLAEFTGLLGVIALGSVFGIAATILLGILFSFTIPVVNIVVISLLIILGATFGYFRNRRKQND